MSILLPNYASGPKTTFNVGMQSANSSSYTPTTTRTAAVRVNSAAFMECTHQPPHTTQPSANSATLSSAAAASRSPGTSFRAFQQQRSPSASSSTSVAHWAFPTERNTKQYNTIAQRTAKPRPASAPPRVRHIPGYSGHVPLEHQSVGQTYGAASADGVELHHRLQRTQSAVAQERTDASFPERVSYTRELEQTQVAKTNSRPRPQSALVREAVREVETRIQRPQSAAPGGHLPSYSGHVPHQKYEYGSTFGQSTARCLQQPLISEETVAALADQSPFEPRKGSYYIGRKHRNPSPLQHVTAQELGSGPGYGGHMPGYRESVGLTYGAYTRRLQEFYSRQQPRTAVPTTHIEANRIVVAKPVDAIADLAASTEGVIVPYQVLAVTELGSALAQQQAGAKNTHQRVEQSIRPAYKAPVPVRATHANIYRSADTRAQQAAEQAAKERHMETLSDGIVPGYTGHVPTASLQFGESVARSAARTLSPRRARPGAATVRPGTPVLSATARAQGSGQERWRVHSASYAGYVPRTAPDSLNVLGTKKLLESKLAPRPKEQLILDI